MARFNVGVYGEETPRDRAVPRVVVSLAGALKIAAVVLQDFLERASEPGHALRGFAMSYVGELADDFVGDFLAIGVPVGIQHLRDHLPQLGS